MARAWSAQQLAIFDWFENPGKHVHPLTGQPRHLVARARAGTGKSTVIREGARRAPEAAILIAAFSKIIQLDMDAAMARATREDGRRFNGRIQTLHSVGLGCVRKFRDRIGVDFSSDRADALARAACGRSAPDAAVRLVSKLHTKGREIAPHATRPGSLLELAIRFECEPDEALEAMGYGVDWVEARALEAMEAAADVQSGDTIDGADMIFLPVRNGWLVRMYDLVVIDEAQDMTVAQLEVALGVLRPGGRVCVVGDDRQAIFGFRGADSGSLDRLKEELDAEERGLTTTYRCGKAIAALAAEIVPDFEAGPDNPEGEVIEATVEQMLATAAPGDFILSRVNAPIVSLAMRLLRSGKRCRVAGKDIGKGLVALVRKVGARSVPDFLARVERWRDKEVARVEARIGAATNDRKAALKSKVEEIVDRAEMLVALADGARSITEVTDRCEALFADDGLGAAGVVTLSSVHRAKGLEADRVFVLRDTLRDTSQEERNIAYVAITRAKATLAWVR